MNGLGKHIGSQQYHMRHDWIKGELTRGATSCRLNCHTFLAHREHGFVASLFLFSWVAPVA